MYIAMYASCNTLGDINDRENADYYIIYFFFKIILTAGKSNVLTFDEK